MDDCVDGDYIEPRDPQPPKPSWWCKPCAVEVYSRRCLHCGKTKRERR